MARTWNPSDKSASCTLSNGDLTATNTSGGSNQGCRATVWALSSEKVYCSFTATPGILSMGVGVANASWTFGAFGGDTTGICWRSDGAVRYNNTTVATIETYTDGDTIHMAVDRVNGKIWFKKNSGNWNNSGTADPASNTEGITISVIGDLFPAFGSGASSTAATISFDGTDKPSGFTEFKETTVVTTTGAGSFTIPTGVTSIDFEAWGAGCAGRSSGSNQDGGGGGGAYIQKTLSVSAGQVVYYNVPAADTTGGGGGSGWFNLGTNSGLLANGAYVAGGGIAQATPNGGAAQSPTGGSGDQGAADVGFSGGNGADAQGGGGSRGGSGGGGSAGPDGNGVAGTAGSGATGGIGGDGNNSLGGAFGSQNGGAGGSNVLGGGGGGGGAGSGGGGGNGGAPGGGGGGGGSSSGSFGNGGRGQIRYSYIVTAAGDATGAASGAGAASGTGVKIAGASGSASGTGSASASGQQVGSTASASGTGAASGAGVAIKPASGSAAGVGAAAASGSTGSANSTAAAAGVGAASGTGRAIKPATGAAAGVGAAAGTGFAIKAASGTAAGVGAALASNPIEVQPGATANLLYTGYPPGVTQGLPATVNTVLYVATGTAGTSHNAISRRFRGFQPGQAFYLGFLYKADRTTGAGILTLTAKVNWFGASGPLTSTTHDVAIDADVTSYTFAEKRHVAPSGAIEGEVEFIATPAASPMQHDLWVGGMRLGLTERGAEATSWIDGVASATVNYDYTGTTIDAAIDCGYSLQDSSGIITGGTQTATYTVIDGSVNGKTSSNGATSLTVTGGATTLDVNSLETDTANVLITWTYNGAIRTFQTTLTKMRAAAPASSGGTYPQSQTTGFVQLPTPWTTFSNIITDRLQITMPSGKTTTRIVVSLILTWSPKTVPSTGPWNVQLKLQRNTGTTGSPTWTDIGTTQNSNPDPYIDFIDETGHLTSISGSINYTFDDTGRTAGNTYEYRAVIAISSGGTSGNSGGINSAGSVTLSAP